MIKVLIFSNWSDCVGTDYVEALGFYTDLASAEREAIDYALDRWEPQGDEEETGVEDEGPDVVVAEYCPQDHDMYRAGGGSFEDDFARM